jgi:hypothetical protein
MSRNIFTSALLVTMLVVMVAVNVQAQNVNVGATATVTTALSITKGTDVAFGNIGATTPGVVTLDPKMAANAYVGATAAVGTVTLGAANTSSIRLVWPATVSLTSGANTITYTLAVNGFNANTQASSTGLTLTSGSCSVTTSATGGYYLWVGGNLGTLSTQATGSYSGTANFSVEYN